MPVMEMMGFAKEKEFIHETTRHVEMENKPQIPSPRSRSGDVSGRRCGKVTGSSFNCYHHDTHIGRVFCSQ
jgi:hypothetical protein